MNMEILEYGDKRRPKVVLLHGVGFSGEKCFKEVIKQLMEDYFVIVPLLDGHDRSNTTFLSIEDEAKKLSKILVKQYKRKFHAILGVSIGGYIALDMLCNAPITTKHLIINSGYIKGAPFAKILATFTEHAYSSIKKGKESGLFVKLNKKIIGHNLNKKDLLSSVSDESIYHGLYSMMTYEFPKNINSIAEFNPQYWYGTKEIYAIKGKDYLKEFVPNLKEKVLGDTCYADLLVNSPKKYAELLYKEIKEK